MYSSKVIGLHIYIIVCVSFLPTTTTYTSKIIVGKKFCKWNLYVFFCIFIAQYPPKFHLIQIYSSKVIGLHIYIIVCVCVSFLPEVIDSIFTQHSCTCS